MLHPDSSLLAMDSLRFFLRDSACALPCPSASASEKFAKMMVNHSHKEICKSNRKFLSRKDVADNDQCGDDRDQSRQQTSPDFSP